MSIINKGKHPIFVLTLLLALAFSSYAFLSNSRYFDIAKNLDIYAKIYKELDNSYVDDIEPAQLMREGVNGMLKSLDPYTNYITEGQIEGYKLKRTAAAADIGVDLLKRDKFVYIKEVFEDLPAHQAGIMAGDRIVAIDGTSAEDRSVADVKHVLQGQPASEVALTIVRGEKEQQEIIKVKRSKAKAKSVPYFGMIDKHTGYVKLKSFTPRCSNEVVEAIKTLQKDNELKSLIFDLRHNGGGLLNEAINMVNIFVPKDELVVSTTGKTEDWKKEYKTRGTPIVPDMPLTVLVDERSASASEIVSGTMQDLDRGVVIGTRSFGKGLVQQTKKLPYNAQFKLTVAKYYTPSGRCVQAINYSGRYQDGETNTVPDSLRTAFTSRNGRTFYDGSGVDPDVLMEKPKYGQITQSLLKNHLIFDYATSYRLANEKIAPATAFTLTDGAFDQFVKFLEDKEYDYKTKSEEVLEKLAESAKEEKYKATIADNVTKLKETIQKEKKQDVYRFKDEIKKLLEAEIISRYYYQEGKVKASLDKDENVAKALELFANEKEYHKILGNS